MRPFESVYEPEFFAPHELVPKAVYEATEALAKVLYSNDPDMQDQYIKFTIYNLFDSRLLKSIDFLRKSYGPALINNWKNGGDFGQRGMRTPDSQYYNPGSMHSLKSDRKVGACDLSFYKIDAESVRQDIKKRQARGESMPFTRMEDEVTWIHVDVKPTWMEQVYFFKP